jgi:L-alanine-DL-glutamate epimerase-like enolase superfamily enzyme
MELVVETTRVGFAEPVETAFGTLRERDLLRVELRAADGAVGVGEAAPLEPYHGVGAAEVRAALEALRPALAASDGEDREALLEACRRTGPPAPALAAVDIALWDLAGRRAGRPVATLLAGSPAPSVPVNATIAAADRAGAATRAAAAVDAGYRCLKLKVGIGDDAGRVAAVRAAAGPDVALRLDANGAWSVEEAEAALGALAPAGLELCEEPVHGVEAMRALRGRLAGSVAIAMDETAATPGAPGSGAADAVCLKVAGSGGITAVLAAASAARAAGSAVYLASSFDGPVGIAAAVHAAAALGDVPPCGLATLGHIGIEDSALTPRRGRVEVPRGPGLGVG